MKVPRFARDDNAALVPGCAVRRAHENGLSRHTCGSTAYADAKDILLGAVESAGARGAWAISQAAEVYKD